MDSGAATNSCIIAVMLSQGTSLARSVVSHAKLSPCASFSASGFAALTARDIHPLLHESHTLRIFLCERQPRFFSDDLGCTTRNLFSVRSYSNDVALCTCAVCGGIM